MSSHFKSSHPAPVYTANIDGKKVKKVKKKKSLHALKWSACEFEGSYQWVGCHCTDEVTLQSTLADMRGYYFILVDLFKGEERISLVCLSLSDALGRVMALIRRLLLQFFL